MAADVDTGHDDEKGGKVRSKKASNKIDMTPMVDLGFLLLTFFMLASSFNTPQVMEINMPKKPKPGQEQPEVNVDKVLNLTLGANDVIYYYKGIDQANAEVDIKTTDYSKNGVRKLLQEKRAEIPGLVVLIKPTDESVYKNVVDLFDEMNITDIKTYAMVDVPKFELKKIEEFKASK